MHRRLLEALVCPVCHAALRIVDDPGDAAAIASGAMRCAACAAEYPIENGIGRLGDSESLYQVADWLSEDALTDELIQRNAEGEERRYRRNPAYAQWVDAIAATKGLIVDIATGPGGSMLGALMPRLQDSCHVVATDAASPTLTRLKAYWDVRREGRPLDFLLCDANQLPFVDGSADAVTSLGGFENVRSDRRSNKPARGYAYVQAARVIRPGGLVFDTTTVYGVSSETAALFSARGDPFASRATLQELWSSLGLLVQSVEVISHGRGKVDPRDGLPLSDSDEWEALQWVLEKR